MAAFDFEINEEGQVSCENRSDHYEQIAALLSEEDVNPTAIHRLIALEVARIAQGMTAFSATLDLARIRALRELAAQVENLCP